MLQEFSGATVRRTLDRSGAEVPEHAHDWPLLSLFVMGAYTNQTELGERCISGPSAILYAAGAAHRNRAGPEGFEQIEIEFDPTWLGHFRLPDDPVSLWMGGLGGAEVRSLARTCSLDMTEKSLFSALMCFFDTVRRDPSPRVPNWFDGVSLRLRKNATLRAVDLAHEVGLHPSWLGEAYRRAAGESIQNTLARLRVEHAARLLRETDAALVAIAIDTGFCDQSHMIRTFRRVLGRLPTEVRDDRKHFRT